MFISLNLLIQIIDNKYENEGTKNELFTITKNIISTKLLIGSIIKEREYWEMYKN